MRIKQLIVVHEGKSEPKLKVNNRMPVTLDRRDQSILWWLLYGVIICSWAMITNHNSHKGWDFPQFYIAGNLPLSATYDRPAILSYADVHLGFLRTPNDPPYVRPAVFSLPLRVFRFMSYWPAFWLWALSNYAAYTIAVILLVRRFSLPPQLLPAFALFYPAHYGTMTGQDISVYLLVLVLAFLSLKDRHETIGGGLLALCLYKFNLVLLVPLTLLWNGRRRAFTIFAIGATVLALGSLQIAPVTDYIGMLMKIREYSRNLEYRGLHGVVEHFGLPMYLYYIAVVTTLTTCAVFARKLIMEDQFCVALVAMLMCSYHSMWYDVTVLVLPISVAWARASRLSRTVFVLLLIAPPLTEFKSPPFYVAGELFLLWWFCNYGTTTHLAPGAHLPWFRRPTELSENPA